MWRSYSSIFFICDTVQLSIRKIILTDTLVKDIPTLIITFKVILQKKNIERFGAKEVAANILNLQIPFKGNQ